jgi:hypothetical protein
MLASSSFPFHCLLLPEGLIGVSYTFTLRDLMECQGGLSRRERLDGKDNETSSLLELGVCKGVGFPMEISLVKVLKR